MNIKLLVFRDYYAQTMDKFTNKVENSPTHGIMNLTKTPTETKRFNILKQYM